MALERIDHYAIRTDNLEPTRAFYVNVIGMKEGPRPDLDFAGHWLYLGETPVVHLIHFDHDADGSTFDGIMGRRDKYADNGTGAVDHLAFRAQDFYGMRKHFAEKGVQTKENFLNDFKLSQIFVDDPNGVTIEMNFFGEGPAAE